MPALYLDGNKLGTLAEVEATLPALLAERHEIELRDDSGAKIGLIVSAAREPICPWEPTLTREELDRRYAAGGGIPLAEFWKRMGVR